ncbi:HEAT repeat domain-containing protein [Marinicella meishanensis]|uniref:HEAT repeat domain-containing protein n=1 Tax=Marinicella meishanensis TaxID=2873263 RepID=UPI001CBCE34E|nr:HEAT repeat domain-containing protein [Marinicella sp. NBU2979]
MSPNKPQDELAPQELELLMMDYLAGHLDDTAMAEFDTMIADNPQLSQELVELQQLMGLIEQHNQQDIPEPSAQMDQNFYAMLHEAVRDEVQAGQSIWSRLKQWLQLPQIRRVSYAFSFLAMGVLLGHYLQLLNQQASLQDQQLALKDQQIQALTVLSLLDMPSANKRLMAIQLAAMSSQPDDAVVDALLTTLQQDRNVNVRLQALEALRPHANTVAVQSGLVAAMAHQESPMVQVALVRLLRQVKAPGAAAAVEQLLQQENLLEPVRTELNQSLNEMI